LNIGTVVKLKEGLSPKMLINKILDNDYLECIWFNGTIIKKEILHKEVLLDHKKYIEELKITEDMTEEEAMEIYDKIKANL